MAEKKKYDAIVIGGGHNGLVNGSYLAKAGLDTVILERRHLVGGAAITEEDYRAKEPNGRAFLRAAEYVPPAEEPDETYPFFLSTGRVVYHFHTRTKTGRSKELREAAPDAFIQVSEDDASRLGIAKGEMLRVTSRRGAAEAPARIGDIEPGTLFMPFHSTKADGLGMGLSICRQLVYSHGGRLWAERRPERGAAFYVALPIAN